MAIFVLVHMVHNIFCSFQLREKTQMRKIQIKIMVAAAGAVSNYWWAWCFFLWIDDGPFSNKNCCVSRWRTLCQRIIVATLYYFIVILAATAMVEKSKKKGGCIAEVEAFDECMCVLEKQRFIREWFSPCQWSGHRLAYPTSLDLLAVLIICICRMLLRYYLCVGCLLPSRDELKKRRTYK